MRRCLGSLLLALILVLTGGRGLPKARAQSTPEAVLQQALTTARAAARQSADCGGAGEALVRAVCAGVLRVGVRTDYPLFAQRLDDARSGYEIDLAREIGRRLGLAVRFATVTPANRLSALADGTVDLVIATMGHTTLRGRSARFIMPHYYASQSVLVGEQGQRLGSLRLLASQTVCVTVGNSSNLELAAYGARLIPFDSPGRLIDQLEAGSCPLVLQDNSFFARAFSNPDFAARYDIKLALQPLPWGMAVAHDGAGALADVLSLLSQILNRDGVLVRLARANHIATGFLEQRQAVWQSPTCNVATGYANPACLLPPVTDEVAPTRFAARVSALEAWCTAHLGVTPNLSIFKIQASWDLVLAGMVNALVLILGTLLATSLAALLFGAWLSLWPHPLRRVGRFAVMVLQSTPVVLALVIAASISNALFAFSAGSALATAMIVLGLLNGAHAGQAIAEAVASLRAERVAPGGFTPGVFVPGVRRASQQVVAFLVNATKGTPAASFIGTPELLNALADTSSFTSDRTTGNVVLLAFYVLCVLVVVFLFSWLHRALPRAQGGV